MAKRKETVYNRILKQFTAINNVLPEEQKLSISKRREIIKEIILPQYINVPIYKVRVKPLKGLIFAEYEREGFDLNYINPSQYAKRKETVYNRILKQFTAINNGLPEEQKLSISKRRKIIKEIILPQYINVPLYKVRVKPLKGLIFAEYEKQLPREGCDLNYINPSQYANVNWFEIDEFIKHRMPDCIYIRVNAGDRFGRTKIFNTRDYDYNQNGVQIITEKIRPFAESPRRKDRIYPYYSGTQKLRQGKKNDGTPENYFLDMVLYINENPVASTETTKYQLPQTREVNQTRKKIKNLLDERFKELKLKKERKKRARKTLTKNLSLVKQKKKKISTSPRREATTKQAYLKQFNKTAQIIELQYQKGYINKAKYKQLMQDLVSNLNAGGII